MKLYNIENMIDKGKYASHGVFIKKIQEKFLPRWSKPKLAVINPIPTSKPREKPSDPSSQVFNINTSSFDIKHRFQSKIEIKPIATDLIQPFLYIEKVLNKKVKKKEQEKVNPKPFMTTKLVKKGKDPALPQIPKGYKSLFEYELDKRVTAERIFDRLLECEIGNLLDIFTMWKKDLNRKNNPQVNVSQRDFVEFIEELLPSKIANRHIKHFFQLYKNPMPSQKQEKEQKEEQKTEVQPKQILQHIQRAYIQPSSTISIKAFSYNFEKYRRAETEIANIMSEKAMKERYKDLKVYIVEFLKEYPELKQAMKGIKQYEETLRAHFQRCYDSYKNPYEDEIINLKRQLQKPIIKYDKQKKQELQQKIQEYQTENQKIYSALTHDFHEFMQAYEECIVKNHDLFFSKRTVIKLLEPIIQKNPFVSRELIEEEVGIKQDEKQRYLECLSDVIVEVDTDKKYIQEDCFTLGELADLVMMKFKKNQNKNSQQFVLSSMKKLVREIKRQFILKNNLYVENINQFPSDQQIPLEILHTCFEMQCTKVLFKNQIWTELLDLIPIPSITSKLHQKAINSNTCMEYLKKYFKKLDSRIRLEVNKSKKVSLTIENAYNNNFGKYAEVIRKVCDGLDHYVEGMEEEQQQKIPEKSLKEKKKVGFGDIVGAAMGDKQQLKKLENQHLEEDEIAHQLIKMIHGGESESKAEQPSKQEMPQNLSLIKTLAKSYFQPEGVNTNAFDIRFYEKINEEDKKLNPLQEQIVKLGTSRLLQNVPPVEQIVGETADPMRISRYLLSNLHKQATEQQKLIKHKQYEQNIGEGIDKSYFKHKMKLQNKPTRYDCEGKSKYSFLLPMSYYEAYIVGQNASEEDKWYLRPHHVETLTENPLSKKDNVIHTEYKSKLEKIPLKKRPEQYVIEENVKRKEDLIENLQERILSLKQELLTAKRETEGPGAKVPPSIIDKYYSNNMEGKEDQQLELAVYDGVLYDLRRKERELLNGYRQKEKERVGEPSTKWWQRKDKGFNHELKKDRTLVGDSLRDGKHHQYVQKLNISEIY